MIAQLGYDNQSLNIYIFENNTTDIDPNAFKGYTQLNYVSLSSNSIKKIDLAVFKDSINLQELDFSFNPLTQFTNSKKIIFPFLRTFFLYDCALESLDSNVVNALPNITYFDVQNDKQLNPLKPNQLSAWTKLQTLNIVTKNQTSLIKEHFNGLSSLNSLSFRNSNIKTVEIHSLLALPNVTFVDFSNNDIYAFEYLQIPTKLETLYLERNKMNYFMLSTRKKDKYLR